MLPTWIFEWKDINEAAMQMNIESDEEFIKKTVIMVVQYMRHKTAISNDRM